MPDPPSPCQASGAPGVGRIKSLLRQRRIDHNRSMARSSPTLGIIRKCRARDIDKKRPGRRWCLYSKKKPGRVIGRHRSRAGALKQEQAIEIAKHGG